MIGQRSQSVRPSIEPSEPDVIVEQSEAPDPHAAIQPDPTEASDADSALGDDASVASASLTSTIYNYRYEHGRRYHAYPDGSYVLPNDQAEQDRMAVQHHVFQLILGDRLFRAPISATPQRVLDYGTGTGIWAIDFADEFPMAAVIGTDLSPIQPDWVPPNVKFYVDDVENDWIETAADESKYDFIHARGMAGSIKDWPKLHRQTLQSLKPGGWLEMQEFEITLRSDDDPDLVQAPYIKQFQEEVHKASKVFGRELDVARQQKQYLIDAGFVRVQDDIYKVPLGTWPRDPKLKEIGKFQLAESSAAIEPFGLGFLLHFGNWEEKECRVLIALAVQDLRSRRNHFYLNLHFVYGQKPEA